jgi:hypothetical protein
MPLQDRSWHQERSLEVIVVKRKSRSLLAALGQISRRASEPSYWPARE